MRGHWAKLGDRTLNLGDRQILPDRPIRRRPFRRELLSHHREYIQPGDQVQGAGLRHRNSRHGGSGKRSAMGRVNQNGLLQPANDRPPNTPVAL